MVFHGSLSDRKSNQVSRTLLSILADLSNAILWLVSACIPVSSSSSLLYKPSRTVPSAPIIIGITVTFIFHNFLVLWQGLFSLTFILWSTREATSTIRQILFFYHPSVWSSGLNYYNHYLSFSHQFKLLYFSRQVFSGHQESPSYLS